VPFPKKEDRDAVSPSRWEAARILIRVERGDKVSDLLDATRKTLIPVDESLLRELVYGCTRQKRLLDHYLSGLCQSPFVRLPQEVKVTLRLGLYQLLFLTRVPAHAAVYESVNLIKQSEQEKSSGFVNAVLRTAETKKNEFTIVGEDELDTLALKYSHPTWLVKRWAQTMTPSALEDILKANNTPHPVYLHNKPGLQEKVVEDLKKEQAVLEPVGWPADTLRLRSHEGGLFTGESFHSGDWLVQDWTPQAMLGLLPLTGGEKVWDVCAAPGGKTVALAWRVGEKGQVIASDISSERRKKLSQNIKRTGLKNVMVFDGEMAKLPSSQKFDLIWVDAPCSGTGVLSRRADLRWRLILKDILSSVDRQKELMDEAADHVYPKGKLVYSTCSMEKEENGDIVLDFLNRHPDFRLDTPDGVEGHSEIV
ncbi:MAG TPA: 16S rRNA (cytosine(967)-C(5))-methyltransferase RsmB, partial [bacterium]